MEEAEPRLGIETRAVHAGQDPDPRTGAVVPPITLASTYRQTMVGGHQEYEYSRSGNPTRSSLERQVASLEGANFGFAFASGLAAEDAVIRSLVSPGDHVILSNDAYGGTYRLFNQVHAPTGVGFACVDLTDPSLLAPALQPRTRVVWVETPGNPRLQIFDLRALADAAHAQGAVLVADNTFATPYLQSPLALGADLVVHSTTKYLGGHSDVVGGFVALNAPDIAERIGFFQNATGAVPGPLDCYLVQRGVKTLAVRMERHCDNAEAVVDFLSSHPRVGQVLYPGLSTHPGHQIARRQMRRFGGMVSFLHRDGERAALDLVARTKLFTLAESLGAVESLIEHPARMTHLSAQDSPMAVDPALVRLSVGIETTADLLQDLEQALSA